MKSQNPRGLEEVNSRNWFTVFLMTHQKLSLESTLHLKLSVKSSGLQRAEKMLQHVSCQQKDIQEILDF